MNPHELSTRARMVQVWEEGRRRLAEGLTEPVLTVGHHAPALLAKCLEEGEEN